MRTAGITVIISVLLGLPPSHVAANDLQAFRPATDEEVRYVLRLPQKEDESLLQVELIVGKTILLDESNSYFFSGSIKKEQITGWGYSFYSVPELGPMTGTLMAPAPDAKKEPRFVSLAGQPFLIRYNSRLPIVVYVPEDIEVRYRVWSTTPESKVIEKE